LKPDGFARKFDSAEFVEMLTGESESDRRLLEKTDVTLGEERRLGAQLLELFFGSLEREGIRAVQRGKDVAYVRAIVDEIHPQMQNAQRYRTIRVYVIDSDVTQALSFPGGTIAVWRGLIEFAESEAALVGIVAHELSHIDRGHQLDSLRRTKLAQHTLLTGDVTPQQFLTAGRLFVSQFMRPFRPEQETEADSDAARWTFNAGYDPMEMATMFQRLHQRDQNRRQPLLDFLRSHPYHIDRFHAVKKLSGEMQADRPAHDLYVGNRNLRIRMPRSKQRFE
jgi:predicted Zn-dependent protease